MTERRVRLLVGWALMAIGAAALVFAFSGLGSASAQPLSASASGAMRISGSSANQAILFASNLAPGGSVRGSVDIRNSGKGPAALTLAPLNLTDLPGPGGGALSPVLALTVRDVTAGSDAIVYSGPFGAMHSLRVGALAKGERRRYSFVATLPEFGSSLVDNAYMASQTSVDYRWSLAGRALARCATRLAGDVGTNRLVGTVGGDRIDGGAGKDKLLGRGGRDCLDGGPGRDRVLGGSGDDLIRAKDGAADIVDCGAGSDDRAIVDKVDTVSGCENDG